MLEERGRRGFSKQNAMNEVDRGGGRGWRELILVHAHTHKITHTY